MKIEIKSLTEEALEKRDYRDMVDIRTPKNHLFFLDGEPEDANLSRDFNDVFSISSLIKEVIQAVKSGEEVTIIETEVDRII